MPIDDSIRLLGLKTGQPITEDWYDHLVDTLIDMADNGAISYDGVINKSLYPKQADTIQIGSDDLELKSIFTRDINISGYAKVSDLEVTNDEIVDSNLYVYGGLYIPKTANIKEIVSDDIISCSIYVYNNLYSNDLYVSNDLVVIDNATIYGLADIYGDLYVNKSVRISGDEHVAGYSYVSKGIILDGYLQAKGVNVDDILSGLIDVVSLSSDVIYTKAAYVDGYCHVSKDIYIDESIYSSGGNIKDLISTEFKAYKGSVDYLDSIELEADDILSKSIYTNKLYSEYVYVPTYLEGYKAVLHDLSLDVLDIYSEINLPDYSIGFIKLSPSLVYDKIRYIDVPASTQMTIPRGIYYVNLPSGVTVEANFNGTWITVLSSPGLIVSDGENLRVNNSNTSSVVLELLMIA